MTTAGIEDLRSFLLQHLHLIGVFESTGAYLDLPEFELYARDYLGFAERELERYQTEPDNDRAHLINCVSHLKRAMDCQFDTFLFAFNLSKAVGKSRLSVGNKIDFLESIGAFSSRSLVRLNTIRNRMEHEYEIPKIEDIEVYFDLVTAFVAVLESVLTLGEKARIRRFITAEDTEKDIGFIQIEYTQSRPSLEACWGLGDSEQNLTATPSQRTEFTFLFRVWLLLCRIDGFASQNYMTAYLQVD
jgi:hypothetical protein